MISQEKWIILTPLQKLPKNVGDLAKLIVAKGFKKWPKVQNIAQSGHTGAAIAQSIRLHPPSCCPGFESQGHHVCFYHLHMVKILHCEKNENNKKRPGLAH